MPGAVNVWTGVTDDPFIFPVFFGTNVVAMVMTIPRSLFPPEQRDWVLWATSSEGDRQIDHVGRSLRTQNPRFELLNTLPPSRHVEAIKAEHEHPSLMRDVFLRIGLQQTFAYRKWDQVPDVMLYTTREPVKFPNGRVLTDDVAEELARYGDTLLKEISYIAGGWPRKTTNDKEFLVVTRPDGTTAPKFPYLAAPWPDKMPGPRPMLTNASRFKLLLIAVLVVGTPFLIGWLIAFLSLPPEVPAALPVRPYERRPAVLRSGGRHARRRGVPGLHLRGGAPGDLCQRVLPDLGNAGRSAVAGLRDVAPSGTLRGAAVRR